MKIQKLSSSKLFYNKWPYKVECTLRGASRVARNNLDELKSWCNCEPNAPRYLGVGDRNINKAELLQFITVVEPFLKDNLQIRTEGSHFNLFCKDTTTLNSIEAALRPWIRKICGPNTEEELNFLLENGHKKRLCDKLPKGKYNYKVFFKIKLPEDKRMAFSVWAENYSEKIEIAGLSDLWLKGIKKYKQDPFMYVEDEKTLSMVGMFLSGYIKKVEHFIPRNSVLTA